MDGYCGEVRAMACRYTPESWLLCDGSLYPVAQYQALFTLIGNKFGGDGRQTFGVPKLNGVVVVGVGDNPTDTFDPPWGYSGGATGVNLDSAHIPPHSHTLNGAIIGAGGRVASPVNALPTPCSISKAAGGSEAGKNFFPGGTNMVAFANSTLTPFSGGMLPHENRQPFLVMRYCICAYGEYPVRD